MTIKIGTNLPDIINGTSDSDTLYGKAGNDKLYGDNGNDNLYGGNGNDTLKGGKGNDKLYGDDGDDTFYYNYKNGGKDTIYNFEPGDDFIDLVGLPAFPVLALAGSAFMLGRIDDWGPAGAVGGQDNHFVAPFNALVTDVPGGLQIDFDSGSGSNNVLTILGAGLTRLTPGGGGDIA